VSEFDKDLVEWVAAPAKIVFAVRLAIAVMRGRIGGTTREAAELYCAVLDSLKRAAEKTIADTESAER